MRCEKARDASIDGVADVPRRRSPGRLAGSRPPARERPSFLKLTIHSEVHEDLKRFSYALRDFTLARMPADERVDFEPMRVPAATLCGRSGTSSRHRRQHD